MTSPYIGKIGEPSISTARMCSQISATRLGERA
jgi:hypothetical protein